MSVVDVGKIEGFISSAQMRNYSYLTHPLSEVSRDVQQTEALHHLEHEEHEAHGQKGQALTPDAVRSHLDSLPVHPDYDESHPVAKAMKRAVRGANRLQNRARLESDRHEKRGPGLGPMIRR